MEFLYKEKIRIHTTVSVTHTKKQRHKELIKQVTFVEMKDKNEVKMFC